MRKVSAEGGGFWGFPVKTQTIQNPDH